MTSANLLDRLRELLGDSGLLEDAAAGLVYARDASHLSLDRPLAVALPSTQAQLRQTVELCHEAGVPLVLRGAGTGLSGGALPAAGSLVVATSRLQKMGAVDAVQGLVRAEAGVVNESVSIAVRSAGFHFAPDPSSQSTAVIGGNIATNAGGPHCLRHGVTLQHLAGLHWYDARGNRWGTGHGVIGERGLDLVSLLCGSEGTLGVIGGADLRLVPEAEGVVTLLAFFPLLDDATRAVVSLLGAGLLPVAVEIVDQAMLVAIEAAFGFGFPTDVAAAMIVEFDDSSEAVVEDGDEAVKLLKEGGAGEVRRAADATEREQLWMCRKKAFGAVGRLAPSYVTMDVVVPLGELPSLVREIQVIKARHGVEIATAFHAGDGNLHPGVHYDDRDPEATRRAHAAADEIIAAALARGGSATGEHGVGLEKIHVLPWQLDAITGRLHHEIKRACDPQGLLNPGKLLPDPAASYAPMPTLPKTLVCHPESLTITAPAETRLSAIQREAMAHGLWLPVGLPGRGDAFGLDHDPRLGDLLAHLAVGPSLFATGVIRDFLLESWLEAGTGEVFHSGAPVFKNVAGYDLHHALCGSGSVYVRHLAATLQLRPCPAGIAGFRITNLAGASGNTDPLWTWLNGRRRGLAAPQVIFDAVGDSWVLIAGREREWDLGRLPAELRSVLEPLGRQAEPGFALPFGVMAAEAIGDSLPPWAMGGPDWTALAPRMGAGHVPPIEARPARFIIQGQQRRLWLPGTCPAPADWVADRVVTENRMLEASAPPANIPLPLLRRLKAVFDPEGAHVTPLWLETEVATGG